MEEVGFVNVVIEIKPESKSYIKDWVPGSNAEDYVVAANISAIKPPTSTISKDSSIQRRRQQQQQKQQQQTRQIKQKI